MKQTIILTAIILASFFESIAQSNNSMYRKNYRSTVKPLTIPLNAATNKIIIKNDTIVFPRGGKNIFLVYKLFYNSKPDAQYRKGIVAMGSGNDAQNPSEGNLNGPAENALCNKAVQEGYVAAIVQYTKGAGTANWNESAQQLASDYDACISTVATKFNIPKSKSVIGGVSYAGFMLLTANAYNNTLGYCKGLLASCSGTSTNAASNFKIPIYNICCAGNYEVGYGNVTGPTLYNAINATVKSNSECIIDNNCTSHCGDLWTLQLFKKLQYWLP